MADNLTIQKVEQKFINSNAPKFNIGDTVKVDIRIKEGEKERIQSFEGVVIAKRHGGLRESFTVRKITKGFGVEKVFPLHSPNVSQVTVTRRGKVRSAKLFYLRERTGKATRIKELLKAK